MICIIRTLIHFQLFTHSSWRQHSFLCCWFSQLCFLFFPSFFLTFSTWKQHVHSDRVLQSRTYHDKLPCQTDERMLQNITRLHDENSGSGQPLVFDFRRTRERMFSPKHNSSYSLVRSLAMYVSSGCAVWCMRMSWQAWDEWVINWKWIV
jgi:hypothetical protein